MTLIRREDAIEAIMKHHDGGLNQINYGLRLAKNEIQALPSAETHEIRTETHECVSETHDLISRERTLRAINGYLESIPYIRNTLADMGRRDATMHCLYIIRELPSAEAEWIPCSERLPSNDGCVLVTVHDGIEFGKYEDGEWSVWVCEHWDKWDAKGTIAWMPLPKPYREENEA